MTEPELLRPAEKAIDWPGAADAALIFFGLFYRPWKTRAECPRRGRADGPLCRIEVDRLWTEALQGIEAGSQLVVQSRRVMTLY